MAASMSEIRKEMGIGPAQGIEKERENKLDVYEFYEKLGDNLFDQADHIIEGEPYLKSGLFTGLLTSQAAAGIGMPGVGKTSFTGDMFRVIDETNKDPNRVLNLGPSASIEDIEVVGHNVEARQTITRGGKKTEETKITHIAGMLTQEHVAINVNESSRITNDVRNVLLDIFEKRTAMINGRKVLFPNLQVFYANFNPSEMKEATYGISEAEADRYAAGAIAGIYVSDNSKDRAYCGTVNKEGQAVVPVVSLNELKIARYIIQKDTFVKNQLPSERDRQLKAFRETVCNEFKQLDTMRTYGQLGRNARLWALLVGRDKVINEDFILSSRLLLSAKLGSRAMDLYSMDQKITDMMKTIHSMIS